MHCGESIKTTLFSIHTYVRPNCELPPNALNASVTIFPTLFMFNVIPLGQSFCRSVPDPFKMRLFLQLILLAIFSISTARSPQHVGKKLPERRVRSAPAAVSPPTQPKVERRQSSSRFMTKRTDGDYLISTLNDKLFTNLVLEFAVNGTAIPDFDFDLGVRLTSPPYH